ncbi:hypothetical protein DOTSEDRAFT_68274 [Dothistroma septosporum NZE10]|uniref:Hcy-binding domain-containing protein n=1 Tax=Dothistroma septosporum (strain NZE10 / CBS 128990) TaxID=675120 RepID=N1Q4D3_DOTSN|nr:hypothetical protein DOTSEDRAFT_68274 [Dothistroma septosporum NZE10]
MPSKGPFADLLASRGTVILDGALATELEVRGHDLNHPLWSMKVIQDPAGIESIKNIHLDYFRAGANIAITASYQASTQGLREHFQLSEAEAQKAVARTVELAQNARDIAYQEGAMPRSHPLLVAGSVGPYGAYLSDGSEYRGDYVRSIQEFRDFHRPRMQALCDAGVDLFAFETMPNMTEIKALLDLLETDFPQAVAWLSCTTRDADHLSDGTTWNVLLDLVNRHEQIVAFGINCVPMTSSTNTLRSISQHTTLPLVCYPNSGEEWDASTKTWRGQRPDEALATSELSSSARSSLADSARDWIENGASLIGGCCRTGPAFIKALNEDIQGRAPLPQSRT